MLPPVPWLMRGNNCALVLGAIMLATLLALWALPASAQWGGSTGYFAIDADGNITVTEAGAAAINRAIGDTSFYLNVTASNGNGTSEEGFATVFTCCTPAPTDGVLVMPFTVYVQMVQKDTGIRPASATVELWVPDFSQLAEGSVSLDGTVMQTCPPDLRACLISSVNWDAALPLDHVIEGKVKLNDGSVHTATLQIPAEQNFSYKLILHWVPPGMQPQEASDDEVYTSRLACVRAAQKFFTPEANPQNLIRYYTCDPQ